MSQTDEHLRRACAGDREALAGLIQQHADALGRRVRSRLPARWRSVLSEDDVLQQTYTDVFLDIATFKPTGEKAFRSWLFKLAENNLVDAIRALQAEKRGGGFRRVDGLARQDSCQMLLDQLTGVNTQTTASQHAARGESAGILERALGRLPETHQRVVRMYDLEQQPMETVARELERSPGAVFLLRNRAHRHLRELLSGKTSVMRRP